MAEASNEKAPAEVHVEDFASLVTNMSRLLTGLGRLKPFSEADVGLAEWLALSALAREDGISNKALGRNLGVSGQRANQVCSSLSKNGLVTVTQSAEDNRVNEIKITAAGKAKATTLNAQLALLLAEALKSKERSVIAARKQIKLVSRVTRVGKPEKGSKENKEERKEARLAAKKQKEAKQAARKKKEDKSVTKT